MFRTSALVTMVSLSASALGFVVQLLLARRYGVNIDVDAYLFALSFPTFVAGLVSALLSYELVPRLVAFETDQAYQKRYITTLLIGVSCLSLLLGIAGSILGIQHSQMLPIDSPLRSYEKLQHLILLGWAISIFQIVQGCLTAILNAHRRYLEGVLLALLPYVGMILLLLLLGDFAGISALPIGMLTGTLLAIFSGGFLIRRHLIRLEIKQLLWQEMRHLAYSSPYTAVAMTCFSSYAVIDAYWAPQAGEGTLATLGYAQRIVVAVGSLIVAGPSAMLVPRFAAMVRDKNFTGFRRSLFQALLMVGAITIAVTSGMAYFAENLVELLLYRGSFAQEDVAAVAKTLRHMTPGMLAMLLSVITLRALFCFKSTAKIAAILGLMWSITYYCIAGIFHSKGAYGIATAYSIVWMGYLCSAIFVVLNTISEHTRTTQKS